MMVLTDPTNGVLLGTLLTELADCSSCVQILIHGISMDSRKTKPGDLFLACHGAKTSGVHYLREAINAGAVAIAAEADAGLQRFINDVPVVAVKDLSANAGIIAARFHDHPSAKMQVIGVTGTNGKTSTACFIAQAIGGIENHKAGLIGTMGYGIWPQLKPGANTTPDPVTIQATLADFFRRGIDAVIMEVTSIGLEQGRVHGVDFQIGIYTNLTVDHLDYHGNMHAYAESKKQLFTCHGLRHAIINVDDEFGRKLAGALPSSVNCIGYGLVERFATMAGTKRKSLVQAVVEENTKGLALTIRSPWGEGQLQVAIGGRYNAYNLLASLAALCLLEVPLQLALDRLAVLSPVPGRLEHFGGAALPDVYVDYAHTPDALNNVLSYLRGQCPGRLICVFGCGGNRDRTKRPQMGAIAASQASMVILTNDNPRHEDPQTIIDDILSGISNRSGVCVELDRGLAIAHAIRSAQAGDMILVAGKGHETYQEVAGQRYPFSDRQLIRRLLGNEA